MKRKCQVCNGCMKISTKEGLIYLYCDFCKQWYKLGIGFHYEKTTNPYIEKENDQETEFEQTK